MRKILLAVTLAAICTDANAVLQCANTDYGESGQWYVGQSRDVLNKVDVEGAIFCVATGAELAYVQKHFTGLRWRSGAGEVFWTGDDAAFILENL